MTNPREPLPDTELEDIVQRSAQLLRKEGLGPEVVLRALVLSVHQKLCERAAPQSQPNIVDQILQQQPGHPQAPGWPAQPGAHPFYGPPGKTRPAGVPDPGQFGPQHF
ncbi:MAG: hypothetical protein V3U45_03845 [bacterium]